MGTATKIQHPGGGSGGLAAGKGLLSRTCSFSAQSAVAPSSAEPSSCCLQELWKRVAASSEQPRWSALRHRAVGAAAEGEEASGGSGEIGSTQRAPGSAASSCLALPGASPSPDQARGRDGCEALGMHRSCRRAGPGLPAARGWALSWASAAAGLQSWADRNPACVVVCVFFSFFTFWFIEGNVGDRVGVSKAIADLAEPSKLLKPCRILSGGVQVWRRACSHPLRTVLFRVGELLGSKQVCCYGSITIFSPPR